MRKRHRFAPRLRDFDLSDPERKRAYNRGVFSVVAGRYLVITRLLSFGRDRRWKRRLEDRLPDVAAPRALDLACGTGDITFLLAERYRDGNVVGLDLNEEMLRRARHHARARRPGERDLGATLTFMRADMARLPFGDESFDLVTGGYALRNAPDIEQALREVHRVLRPGGTAGFLDFSRSPVPRRSRAQLALLGLWGWLWGWLLHGNGEVYGYIAASLRAYPDRDRLHRLILRLGFRGLVWQPLFFSMVELTWFRKS
jgi:ubiquinone/menaquinone biosynthesis methyltransferase